MNHFLLIHCRPALKTAALLLLFFTCLSSGAQQYNNWVFGAGAGIGFNPGSGPVPYNTYGHKIGAFEGSASISDADGNLLFYTNGEKIWNREHKIMFLGDGLLGHQSAYQSALIVPRPNSDSLFYVFTADAIENNMANGYNYSVVNIKGDNGLGEVTAKNKPMQAPGTERLTAARHANGIDVWIITNDFRSNTFRAWRLSCNGLGINPVVSQVGEVLDEHDRMSIGALKVSPDGKMLCQTHFSSDVSANADQFFQLFDFDNSTGRISNARTVHLPGTGYASCEFSPNSSLLYLSEPLAQEIEQFEVKLPSAAAIAATQVIIPADYGMYALQLAPDNKIYLTNSTVFLSVINQPDVKGTGCDFQINSYNLDNRHAWLSLPPVLHELPPTSDGLTYTTVDACTGTVQFNGFTSIPGAVEWYWDFGDGTESTVQNPLHSFNPANAVYQVRLRISPPNSCGYISRTVYVRPGGVEADADFEFEADCETGRVEFTNRSSYSPGVQVLWDFGDGNTSSELNPIHTYSSPGSYPVRLRLITPLACLDDTKNQLLDLRLPGLVVPPDQSIIERQTVQLYARGTAVKYEWTPSDWLNNPDISDPVARPVENITYHVTATTTAGCTETDSVRIQVTPLADIYVPTAFTPNGDGRNDRFGPVLGHKFELLEFSIYNRWGQRVFRSSSKNDEWDGSLGGKRQESGAFVWFLKAKSPGGQVLERKGSFVLIR